MKRDDVVSASANWPNKENSVKAAASQREVLKGALLDLCCVNSVAMIMYVNLVLNDQKSDDDKP